MQFALFKGEKNINDLASRLFHIEGPCLPAEANLAAQSLLQANPALANLSSLPVGSVITIPETPFPVNSAELASPPSLVLAAHANQMSQGLTALQGSLASTVSVAETQANATVALVNKLQKQTQDKTLVNLLNSISKQAKGSLKAIPSAQTQYEQAITQMQQDLAKAVVTLSTG